MTRRLGGGKWMFALPNEAEWEKAARGPDGFDYGLGNYVSDAEVALYNWKKNPGAEITVAGWNQTRAQYKPNRYGVYHASGNVAEWTQSVSRPFNRQRPFVDDDRNLDETSGQRVIRGGSWYTASIAVLSLAYRETFQPSVTAPYLGFRIVARPLP
jgi:formylglycine-generating enzyme required for sulfatase activity